MICDEHFGAMRDFEIGSCFAGRNPSLFVTHASLQMRFYGMLRAPAMAG
jgi:hypothetical protein